VQPCAINIKDYSTAVAGANINRLTGTPKAWDSQNKSKQNKKSETCFHRKAVLIVLIIINSGKTEGVNIANTIQNVKQNRLCG